MAKGLSPKRATRTLVETVETTLLNPPTALVARFRRWRSKVAELPRVISNGVETAVIVLRTRDEHDVALELYQRGKEIEKGLAGHFTYLDEAIKGINGQKKEVKELPKKDLAALNTAVITFRREEQKRAQDAARAKAAKEAPARTELEARDAGDAVASTFRGKGKAATRDHWSARVDSLAELVCAIVASNPKLLERAQEMARGNWDRVEVEAVRPSPPILNGHAKKSRETLRIPGVVAVNNPGIANT